MPKFYRKTKQLYIVLDSSDDGALGDLKRIRLLAANVKLGTLRSPAQVTVSPLACELDDTTDLLKEGYIELASRADDASIRALNSVDDGTIKMVRAGVYTNNKNLDTPIWR